MSLTTRQLRARIAQLRRERASGAEIFAALGSEAASPRKLAWLIAAHVDPLRASAHEGKVDVLVLLTLFQALVAFVLGFFIGIMALPGSTLITRWLVGMLVAGLPLLFTWGFYTHRVMTYNVFVALTLLQLPQGIGALVSKPLQGALSLLTTLIVLGYVLWVREKIFPGFFLFGPRKVGAQYRFPD